MRRAALLLGLACALFVLPLGAQAPTLLKPGDIVRVRHDRTTERYTVLAFGPTDLHLRSDERDSLAVGFQSVRALWISTGFRGRSERAWRGAVRGLGIGALAGGTVGFLAVAREDYSTDLPSATSSATQVALFALGGGAIGAGIGTILGRLADPEVWQRLPLESVGIVAGPGARPALGVSLRF